MKITMMLLVAGFLAAAGLTVTSARAVSAAGEPSKTPEVTARTGNVTRNDQMDGEPADEKSPQVLRRRTWKDKTWLRIESLTYTPPKKDGFDFASFDGVHFVDVEGNSASETFGVVVGKDGVSMQSVSAIKVFKIQIAPTDAGTFPLKAEGNLTKKGSGDTAWFWRAMAKDAADKRIELVVVPDRLVRGQTLTSLKAKALNDQGVAQEGVNLLLEIRSDVDTSPLLQGTGTTHIDIMLQDPEPLVYRDGAYLNGMTEPGPGATKLIVTATDASGQGYGSARVEIPFGLLMWIRNGNSFAFDTVSLPCNMTVPCGVTSTDAALRISASIAPSSVEITAQGASISPNAATGVITPCTITAAAQPNTAFALGKTLDQQAMLVIHMKNLKEQGLTYCYIHGPNQNGVPTDAQKEQIKNGATAIWEGAAAVDFGVTETTLEISQNLGQKPTVEQVKAAIASNSNAPSPTAENKVVFVVEDYEGVWDTDGNMMIVKTSSTNLQVGAALGTSLGVDPSGEAGNVMAGPGVPKPLSVENANVRYCQGMTVNP